jgi:ribonuclease M5
MDDNAREEITREDLIDAGLIAGPGAKQRREKLGKLLKIGYTNGKQLHKRLMMFQVSSEDFAAAMKAIRQEEQNA